MTLLGQHPQDADGHARQSNHQRLPRLLSLALMPNGVRGAAACLCAEQQFYSDSQSGRSDFPHVSRQFLCIFMWPSFGALGGA
jgi:hypothetical protein